MYIYINQNVNYYNVKKLIYTHVYLYKPKVNYYNVSIKLAWLGLAWLGLAWLGLAWLIYTHVYLYKTKCKLL